MAIISSAIQAAAQDRTNQANKEIAESTNKFNAEQAALQRQFEKEMSNSAYQRAYADAEKAGINPTAALLGNGGASTPSGSSASGVAYSYKSPLASLAGISQGLGALASSAYAIHTIKKLGEGATVAKALSSAKKVGVVGAIIKALI